MNLTINGEKQTSQSANLKQLLVEQGYDPHIVATALNGRFIPRHERENTPLIDGLSIEILSPQVGG